MLLLSALSVSIAGQAQLQNDDFSDGEQASYQTGFVRDECFATVFVPEEGDYPFTLAREVRDTIFILREPQRR